MLINQFLAEGKFTEDLKKAVVTPIFKKEKKLFAWELQTNINYRLTSKSFWAFASWENFRISRKVWAAF